MSVRVNLLPEDVRQREGANRARIVAGLLGLVLVAGLAFLTFMQRGDISDAEQRLAEVEQQNQELQADVAALQPFADLEARATGAADLVEQALAPEVSLAAVLQDLSLVFPPTAELTTLSISAQDEDDTPAVGGTRLVVGSVAAQGRVVSGIAPGVERLLIDFDRAAIFDNPFVTSTSVDENDVTTFSFEADLGPEARTQRYVLQLEAAS